jgi:hypothetical protein
MSDVENLSPSGIDLAWHGRPPQADFKRKTMRAVKWVTAVFAVGAILTLMCYASTHVMIGASHKWEGLLFLFVLIAFIGVAIRQRMLDPHSEAAREATSSGSSITRRGWTRIALATCLLIAFALWALRTMAVYDACLDRINYDRTRWHECD